MVAFPQGVARSFTRTCTQKSVLEIDISFNIFALVANRLFTKQDVNSLQA